MTDGNRICVHENFLDQEPDDFSASYQIQAIRIVLQACTEVTEAINHAQIARLILNSHAQGL